jgi:hypothetical protein
MKTINIFTYAFILTFRNMNVKEFKLKFIKSNFEFWFYYKILELKK